jgi:hypothetical protein
VLPYEGPIPEPLAPQVGTVVISSDVPARVEHLDALNRIVPRRLGGRWEPEWSEVCDRTPCTVSLEYGDHELQLTALDDPSRRSLARVSVARRAVAINHTLGQKRTSAGTLVGGFLLAAGALAIVLPYGLDMDGPTSLPDVLIGAGIATMFTGVTLMMVDPNISQPGTTRQWRPDSAIPAAPAPQGMHGASFKVRF